MLQIYTFLNFSKKKSTLFQESEFLLKFKNTPKTDIDTKNRHAESKAINDFKGTGSFDWVDSKNNERSNSNTGTETGSETGSK